MFAQKAASHWVIPVEFLFVVLSIARFLILGQSLHMTCLCCCLLVGIYFVVPPFLILYSSSKDLMIDFTHIFMLINNLICLESNAICMFFLQTVNGRSKHMHCYYYYQRVLLCMIYDCVDLFFDFFTTISLKVIRERCLSCDMYCPRKLIQLQSLSYSTYRIHLFFLFVSCEVDNNIYS